MDYKINIMERNALRGLPYLAQLVYLIALRPYMDYSTGIVGIKRGISYQSLREELYVEPHKGYKSGSPSKDQMRRAIRTLERAGLISIQSEGKKLILKCELATWDYSDQNKVATKPPQQPTTKVPLKNNNKTSDCEFETQKAATGENAKATTPPVSDINYIFLCDAFEKFWSVFPLKQSKQKAWEIFQQLSPNAELVDVMITSLNKQCNYRKEALSHGHWMPNWRHATNWLLQRGWEDELPVQTFLSEKVNASSKTDKTKQRSGDALWEYCKDAFDEECESSSSNVVSLGEFKQKQCSY